MSVPCVIFASKPDQFFCRLAREFVGRVLIAVAGVHAFYNPWCSFFGDIAERIAHLLPIFLYVFDRHDAAVLLVQAVRQWGEHIGLRGRIAPTFQDIIDMLPNVRPPKGYSLNPALKKSLLAVLLQIVHGPLGITMNCDRGWDFVSLLKNGISIIVDTSRLSLRETEYLVTCLITDIRLGLAASNPAGILQCVIIIDEATPLVQRRGNSDLSPLAQLFTLLRGSGIGLAVGYHSPASVEPIVRSNSYFTLCGNLNHGDDIRAAAQACCLTTQQAKSISHLPRGMAVLKMSGRYTHPFLVQWEPIHEHAV